MDDIVINEEVARRVLETVDAGLVDGVGHPIPGRMCVEAAVCYAMGLPHGDDPSCVNPTLRDFKITLNDVDWSGEDVRARGLRRLAVAQLGSDVDFSDSMFGKQLIMLAVSKYVPIILNRILQAPLSPDILTEERKAVLNTYISQCSNPVNEDINFLRGWVSDTIEAAYDLITNMAIMVDDAAALDSADLCTELQSDEYHPLNDILSAITSHNQCRFLTVPSLVAEFITKMIFRFNEPLGGDSGGVIRDAVQDSMLMEFAEEVVQILIKMKAPGCRWLYLTEERP